MKTVLPCFAGKGSRMPMQLLPGSLLREPGDEARVHPEYAYWQNHPALEEKMQVQTGIYLDFERAAKLEVCNNSMSSIKINHDQTRAL